MQLKLPFPGQSLKRFFLLHLFKTVGALSGLIFLGIFGFIFGFIGGTMVDQLFSGHHRKRRIRQFLENTSQEPVNENSRAMTAAAGAAAVWFFCKEDAAVAELVSAAAAGYFPDLPGGCMEVLAESSSIDYLSAAEYFGGNANAEQTAAFNKMISACGLGAAASRAASSGNNSDAARILAAAGYAPAARRGVPDDDEDFKLLGLTPGADEKEIKKVYHRLASQFHPDAADGLSAEQRAISEDAFKRIQSAYERLRTRHL